MSPEFGISHVAYANVLGTKTTVASIHGLLSGITYDLGKFLFLQHRINYAGNLKQLIQLRHF